MSVMYRPEYPQKRSSKYLVLSPTFRLVSVYQVDYKEMITTLGRLFEVEGLRT